MALSPGTHNLGPDSGTMEVHTYREGLGKKVGHDLIIDVEHWEATVDVAPDGAPLGMSLEADARSLQIREGLHGAKPLSDKDRREIRKNIDEQILGGQPIAFNSSSVEGGDGRLTVQGDLTIAGTTKPATFELDLAGDGRISGTLPVIQSEFGIKPYRAFMGALKVRDDLEVVLDVRLPSG